MSALSLVAFVPPLFSPRVKRVVEVKCKNSLGQRMASKRSKLQLLFDLAQRTFSEQGQPAPAQVDVLKLALSA